ncbi:unnamed protein product, partial [Mesorhabditis spiculigera]
MATCDPMLKSEFDTDPQYYLKFLTYASVGGLLVNSFGIYIILFHSPPHFKTYRWHLLNYQICSTFCDVILGLCTAPVFFLPSAVGRPTGLFVKMGVSSGHQMTVASTFLHLILAATMHMFFYRWQMVVPNGSLLKFSRKVKAIILIITYILFLTPHFILLPPTYQDQPSKRIELVEDFPNYRDIVDLPDVIIFYSKNDMALAAYMFSETLLGGFLGCGMTWFWLHTAFIFHQKGKYSNESKQLQYRKYLLNLSSQMTIPIVTILYPGSLLGLIIIFRLRNVQARMELSAPSQSSASTSTIAIICSPASGVSATP